MEPTSVSLLDRLREQPHQDDWTRLISIYRPFVLRFIRFHPALAPHTGDSGRAVMAKLVEHLARFQRHRDGSFRTWLKTITVNEVNAFWRKRLRHRNIDSDSGRLLLDSLVDPAN